MIGETMIGKTISHYRVIDKLGGGGMGVVYEAQDETLGRHLALKFLLPELSSDAYALERVQREARAMTRFRETLYLRAFFFARLTPARNPCSTKRLYPDLSMLARVAAEMPPGVAASWSNSSSEILDSRQVSMPSAIAWLAAVKAVLRSRPSFSAAPASASSA